jgi:hypothetical protein
MKQNVSMVRGRTRIFNVRVTDGTGAAYILGTGEKLIFGVKKNYFDSGYLIKKSITSVNATSEPGVYAVVIKPEDTASLTCDIYCYDVGLQSGSDYYSVIDCSHFVIEPNITGEEVQ